MLETYRWEQLSVIRGLLEVMTFLISQVNRSRVSFRLRE